MMHPIHHKIFGTTTINEKGQLVIPAEARAKLKLEAGDRFMVMGAPFGDALIIVKTDVVEQQMQSWTDALNKNSDENE